MEGWHPGGRAQGRCCGLISGKQMTRAATAEPRECSSDGYAIIAATVLVGKCHESI